MAPHSSTPAWKNPMDGGAWKAAVHGVAEGQTRLRDFTFTFHFSLSCIGEGNGNPLQCSCLENPRDGGAWWAAVYGVAQSWTRLKRLSSSRNSIISDKQPCNDFSKYSEFSTLENKNICRHYKLWTEFIYCFSYCPRGKK